MRNIAIQIPNHANRLLLDDTVYLYFFLFFSNKKLFIKKNKDMQNAFFTRFHKQRDGWVQPKGFHFQI